MKESHGVELNDDQSIDLDKSDISPEIILKTSCNITYIESCLSLGIYKLLFYGSISTTAVAFYIQHIQNMFVADIKSE